LKKRAEFVDTLLLELTSVYMEIKKITGEMDEIASNYQTNYYSKNNEVIHEQIDMLKTNIEQIKQYNYQATEEINQWYLFINNHTNIIKLSFPWKFHLKRLKLQKNINKINKQINRIAVENRLIKEKLTKSERLIEGNILQQIKQTGIYKEYEELIKQKEELLSDLKYLLPTIPLQPQKIDLNNINLY